MVDDVKRAADCGVKGVVIEIPCNEEMITKAYGWTMERALELSIQASLAAKEAGLYTVCLLYTSGGPGGPAVRCIRYLRHPGQIPGGDLRR